MTYTNNNSVSTFHVINKNGKLFVRHSFVGINNLKKYSNKLKKQDPGYSFYTKTEQEKIEQMILKV